jgi:streptogramin lyase
VARKPSVHYRLGIEKLEDRCLLSGGITEFAFPGGSGAPVDITSGPDGNLWFTQVVSVIDTSSSTFVGRITTDGRVTEFPIPEQGFAFPSQSLRITSGPDGNLWFTGNNIGRITPTGVVTQFTLPPQNNGTIEIPFAITAGPDGNIWFTEIPVGFTSPEPAGRIGRITPTGQITEFTLPSAGSEPRGITPGPDGNLWFTENGPAGGRNIGRITPGGVVTEFALPDQNSTPEAITHGPDGNLWFTGAGLVTTGPGVPTGTFIGRITLSGDITEFPIPDNAFAPAITSGSDGNLYFTEQYLNKIGRITPDGTISEFTIPTSSALPVGITAGPDGNVWFAEGLNSFSVQGALPNQIGKFIVSVTGTPNQRYVSQLYLDLLHRPADPNGLAGWVSMLDNGTERFQIVLGIENGAEYHNLEVQNLYSRFLNRAATPAELSLWQSYFNLGGTGEQVEAFVIGSDEYLVRHANQFDSHAFLTSAYIDIFNRPIDATGVQAWTQALANGMSRSDVALALLRSLESDRDEVIDLYGRLLHRAPDPSGFGFFTTALQNGLSNELAIALLTTSSEYLASVGIS